MRDYPRPVTRPLAVFAFDPSLGRTLNNHMILDIPYEELAPGPIGRKLAVVDYDASNDVWYQPVNLDHKHVSLSGGLVPTEGDPRFHQQMVYAVASETIRRFEFALGREVKWRPHAGTPRDDPYRACLRIFPHAFQQANAFFDPKLNALLFGYFAADVEDVGDSLPGQTIFTCLSHDIVAHETTHAILHSIRSFFSKPTSPDTSAFHEAFADIVALFQHFSVRDALAETIRRTGGDLYRRALRPITRVSGDKDAGAVGVELTEDNPLVGLAQQFGHAMGMRQALRRALGTTPDPQLLAKTTEPHDRGSILVAAVFDAYFSVYIQQTRPLLRVARAGSANGNGKDLHPDLVTMLADRAAKIAERFLVICIRAIDYCPPVDVQFGEFLRAIVTADRLLVPEDPLGFRGELIKAFRRRGMVPDGVRSYSEDALLWCGPADRDRDLPPVVGLIYDVLHETSDQGNEDAAEARKQNAANGKQNAKTLHAYAEQNRLGLALDPDAVISVRHFHPVYRIGPEGRLMVEFIVEYMQERQERFDPNDLASDTFQFRGGSTVIFDHRGRVRYAIDKSLNDDVRLQRQRAYLMDASSVSAFTRPRADEPSFAAIHRGC